MNVFSQLQRNLHNLHFRAPHGISAQWSLLPDMSSGCGQGGGTGMGGKKLVPIAYLHVPGVTRPPLGASSLAVTEVR